MTNKHLVERPASAMDPATSRRVTGWIQLIGVFLNFSDYPDKSKCKAGLSRLSGGEVILVAYAAGAIFIF